jgi:mycothiol system anti-sigma-R factor
MSCGNPHATPCSEVLDRLFVFIDSELDSASEQQIRQHLDECGPCLAQSEIERCLKSRVAKSCACAPVDDEVRVRVVQRFTSWRVTYRIETDPPG